MMHGQTEINFTYYYYFGIEVFKKIPSYIKILSEIDNHFKSA